MLLEGLEEICQGLERNKSITTLNLSSNYFGEKGAMLLASVLSRNESIKHLDLSRNALGFRSIHSLMSCCRPRHITVTSHGNYLFEEILNSVTHGIGFLASVVGANLLISASLESGNSDYHFWACFLYSFSMLFLFLSSCLFHSFFMLPSSNIYVYTTSLYTTIK